MAHEGNKVSPPQGKDYNTVGVSALGLGAAAVLLTLFLLLMNWLAEVVHGMQFSISRW
jgi:hypothetical protein